MLLFDWDINKAKENVLKHNVTFEEAKTVFEDENGILIADPDHSEFEERFILIGFSAKANMLIVCHCYRQESVVGEIIRIISARKPTKKEIEVYKEGNNL